MNFEHQIKALIFYHLEEHSSARHLMQVPKEFAHLGDLISIEGSLIDSVLSMHWADYRKSSKKAKVHLGFDINHSIPANIFLTDGKGDERPFVSKILTKGQTGIMDCVTISAIKTLTYGKKRAHILFAE